VFKTTINNGWKTNIPSGLLAESVELSTSLGEHRIDSQHRHLVRALLTYSVQ